MAISDNYSIIESAFSCDSTDGWGKGGNASDPTSETSGQVEGSGYLGLTTSDTGDSYWYHDIVNRFKITETSLGLWFRYVKGKGANYLVQDGSALVVRLYFGGTSKYADYRLTEKGDIDLKFGWQPFIISGTNLNGGSVGGGHNGTTDFYLDIYRFELHLNVSNKVDKPLGLDAVFIGTQIEITDQAYTLNDLARYTFVDRSFPIGTIENDGNMNNVKSTLKIGSGATLSQSSKFIFMNQFSTEVKTDIIVDSGGKIDFDNCFVSKPDGYSASILCDGVAEYYGCKFLNFDTIEFTKSSICDFANCSNVVAKGSDTKEYCTIHDDSGGSGGAFKINGNGVIKSSVYGCRAGFELTSDVTIADSSAMNNQGDDIVIDDGVNAVLIDCNFQTVGG